MIPSEPKKIRALIRRIERSFEKDPNYRDGSGSRFLLGPLHLLLGDVAGALKHYIWFEDKFPDSSDEPSDAHCWALTMWRANRPEEALFRLRRAHLANPYLIPAILGLPHGQPEVWRGSNWEAEDYVAESPPEFINLWQPDEKLWLRSVWDTVRASRSLSRRTLICASDLTMKGLARSGQTSSKN